MKHLYFNALSHSSYVSSGDKNNGGHQDDLIPKLPSLSISKTQTSHTVNDRNPPSMTSIPENNKALILENGICFGNAINQPSTWLGLSRNECKQLVRAQHLRCVAFAGWLGVMPNRSHRAQVLLSFCHDRCVAVTEL